MKARTGFLGALLSGVVLAGLALSGAARADLIPYEGVLTLDNPDFGQVEPGSDFGDWWFFTATAGERITITGRRLEAALDPAFDLYFGFGDTDLLEFVGFADDELPPFIAPGPFGDPQLTFTAAQTGTYSIHLWSFASDDPGPDGFYDYLIALTPAPVPEPAMFGLFGAGLAGLGLAGRGLARRRRK